MFRPLTVIQGPPGTGKTVTVVRLAALYAFVNETLDSKYRRHNIKPQVMICGPSNKSVDVIAGEPHLITHDSSLNCNYFSAFHMRIREICVIFISSQHLLMF